MSWTAKPEIVTRDGKPTGKKCISCGRIMGQSCDCVSRIYDDEHNRWILMHQKRRERALKLVEKYRR